jgi:hypothetical protein
LCSRYGATARSRNADKTEAAAHLNIHETTFAKWGIQPDAQTDGIARRQ